MPTEEDGGNIPQMKGGICARAFKQQEDTVTVEVVP